MKTKKSLVFLGILLVLLTQAGCAQMDFDDFSVTVYPDEINVSGSFEVNITFERPTDTDSISMEVEILVDGVTVFFDEDYDIHFTEDEDKTITLSSDDFPGPDLDSDAFNDNLMNRLCGEVDVEARVSGDDLEDSEYSEEASLTIGDDAKELSFEMDPSDPKASDEITFTVFDEDDDEMSGAKVKLTWLDDPDGDKAGKWDSDDAKKEYSTNSKGERSVVLEEVFKDVNGTVQVDVYDDGYCLERETIKLASEKLNLNITPHEPVAGEPTKICVTTSDGAVVPAASVYVYGPGYSKTYTTSTNGCVSITLISVGTYRISASKDGYDISLDNVIDIEEKSTTTTSTTTTTTSAATTRATTTTKPASEKLFIYLSDMTPYVNESVVVTVKDVQNRPIKGITISVSPSGLKGKTNEEGIFSFTPASSGAYTISAASDTQAYSAASESIEATVPPAPEKPEGGGQSSMNLILLLVAGVAVIAVLVVIVLVFLLLKSRDKKPKRKEWSGNKPERWISLKDDARDE